jgi:uncharacterized protein
MLITPLQLEKEPLLFDESIPAGPLEYAPDINQVGPMPVTGRADLVVEHRGHNHQVPDIRVRAAFKGEFDLLCARCVEPVRTPVSGNFDLIFRPVEADSDPVERSISTDETEIGYYEESGLSLEDVVREQVLLSLPSRTLCNADCKGLCPRCGQNLNTGTCNCEPPTDVRWSALSGLASTVKSK